MSGKEPLLTVTNCSAACPAEHAGQCSVEGLNRGRQSAGDHPERAQRAEDELLISGGSQHLISAGILLGSINKEHVSQPVTTQ